MEPITMAIVTALSTGATFVGKEAAKEFVKDAYAGLKGWIQSHYPGVSIEQLEKQPTSKARQEVVGEDLERERASEDPELVRLARTLVVCRRVTMTRTKAPYISAYRDKHSVE